MSRKRPSPKNHSFLEPPKKKKTTNNRYDHEKLTTAKKNLLKTLSDIDDEVKKLKLPKLQRRVKELREEVKVLFEWQEHVIKRLNAKIDDLKEEIKRWKDYY